MERTTYAGLVDEKYLGQEVVLKGWVQKRRDLGNLIFVDLRDREGIVQLVFSQEFGAKALEIAENIRSEYVIEVEGKVVKRANANPNMKTGQIEVEVSKITVLNEAKTTPFDISDDINASDESTFTIPLFRSSPSRNVKGFEDQKSDHASSSPLLR